MTLTETRSDPVEKSTHTSTSNAVTRSWSDLDVPIWLSLLGASAFVRSVVLHPLTLAATRKRVSVEFVSLRGTLADARKSGWRAMYRGLPVAVAGNVIGEVTYLATVEYTREARKTLAGDGTRHMEHSYWRDAFSGVAGESVSLLLTTPFAVVVNRQMTAEVGLASANQYMNARRTVASLWNGSNPAGVRALYMGLSASLAMLPASAVWWATYGETKLQLYSLLVRFPLRDEMPLLNGSDNVFVNAAAAVVASTATAVISNPVNVVRTRLQTLNTQSGVRGRVWNTCRDLVMREGVRAFWKGTSANALVAVADGILLSGLYELTKLAADRSRRTDPAGSAPPVATNPHRDVPCGDSTPLPSDGACCT